MLRVFFPALMLRQSRCTPQSPVRGTQSLREAGLVSLELRKERRPLSWRQVSPALVAGSHFVTLHYEESSTWVCQEDFLHVVTGPLVLWVGVAQHLCVEASPCGFI